MLIQAIRVRKGYLIVYNSDLYRVTDRLHHTPGNLRAIIRLTMKSLSTGQKLEERFRPGDMVDKASLDVEQLQFLYNQSGRYVFMNTETYDQLELDEETVGDARFYLTENCQVQALLHKGTVVGLDLPPKVDLKVSETTPNVKGATVANSPKPATLETGLVVQVPPFVEEGELVRIDTETGAYVERVK